MQIIPRIYMKGNCREAIELYKEAFGASVDYMMTYGNVGAGTEDQKDLIMNSQLDANGLKLHLADNMREEIASGNQVSFTVVANNPEEVKEIFSKLKVDGNILMEPMETFFSPCHCSLVDKFGITWQINCPKK
jgi:PhnB protein